MAPIAFVDDSLLLRSAVVKILQMQFPVQVYEYKDGRELVDMFPAQNYTPSLLITDIAMPRLNGYDTVTWFKKNYPSIPVLVMSISSKEEAIIRMLRLSIQGYLIKNIQPTVLFEAVEKISTGHIYYYIGHNKQIIDRSLFVNGKKVVVQHEPLTPKEEMILKLMAMEYSYQEIADKLCLSKRTVDTHKANISQKLNIETRHGLALYAIQMGLSSNEDVN